MKNFIGYTTGLECFVGGIIRMVKIEYTEIDSGIELAAVSGRNLAKLKAPHYRVISRAEFDDRPRDPYDGMIEARWALAQLELAPAADHDGEEFDHD